jgi:hypothetical protein
MKDPSEENMQAARRVLTYLQNTSKYKIKYKRLIDADGTQSKMANQITAYVDASHQDDKIKSRSTLAYLIFMNGGPISWRVQLSKRIGASPTGSEFMALSDVAREVMSIRNFLAELGYEQTNATEVHEDNSAAIQIANNPKCHDGLKQLPLNDFHQVRDPIEEKEIVMVKVDTDENIADVLTKPLTEVKHKYLTAKIYEFETYRKN